ncbi:hypothetical protein Tco_1580279, partial [Tanacetum coccineum]
MMQSKTMVSTATTGKGFLEDDESDDDSILIVDPGWDDYSLQALKLNRPVPLCPEARRARMPESAGNTSITPDSVHAGGRVH